MADRLITVTANLKAAPPNPAAADIGDAALIEAARPDVVFLQEVKDRSVAALLGAGWGVFQDRSSPDRAGSALAWRTDSVRLLDAGLAMGVRVDPADRLDLLSRWIPWADLEHDGHALTAFGLHMPPPRYPKLQQRMAGRLVRLWHRAAHPPIAGADWNLSLLRDPLHISRRTEAAFSGHDIDGFLAHRRFELKNLKRITDNRTRSDHPFVVAAWAFRCSTCGRPW